VTNGVLVITYGYDANAVINGLTLTLTPYETPDNSVVWRCGAAAAPIRIGRDGHVGRRQCGRLHSAGGAESLSARDLPPVTSGAQNIVRTSQASYATSVR
jgi:hypothetical protein